MTVAIKPSTPATPATNAIQDPAARRFAQAVADTLRTLQSADGARTLMDRAAEGMNAGGTPAAVAAWLFKSELYQKLAQSIAHVDLAAKQALLAEAEARANDIATEAAARAQALIDEAAARVAALSAEASARADAIQAEAAARIGAIAAEAAAREADIDALTASLQAEAGTRADAIAAEQAARIQALLDEAGARQTAITAEAALRAAGDEQLAQQLTTLSAEVDANAAAIVIEAAARADLDSAAATQFAGLQAEVEWLDDSDDINRLGAEALARGAAVGASAMVATEEAARIEADAAEALQRTTLAAQLRGSYAGTDLNALASGLLYQERIARVSADQSLAQQITLLSAGAGEQFDYQTIWYFDDGIEDWGGNGTPTAAAGWLRPADHASAPYVISPAGIGADGAQYSQLRLRVRKTGTPTWAGLLWWETATATGWDVSRRITIEAPDLDGNGIGVLTLNPGWSGTIERLRLDLTAAQDASNFYELDWIAVGRPSPGASSAQLYAEQTARADAIAAEAAARENLSSALVGEPDPGGLTLPTLASGLLYDERQARSSADAAEASARQSLSTKLTGTASPGGLTLQTLSSGLLYDERQARSTADATEVAARQSLSAKLTGANDPSGLTLATLASGLLYEERQARASAVEAVASELTALSATVATNSADILAEQTARADADAALATDLQTLTATVAGNSAAIGAEASARATEDAVLAQRIDTAVARLDTAEAAISTETSARATADAALTGRIDTAEARLDDAEAAIVAEQSTRATEDAALASSVSALTATVNADRAAAAAAITTEQTARADADAALASSLNALTADVEDSAAQIAALQLVSADDTAALASELLSLRAESGWLADSDDINRLGAEALQRANTVRTEAVITEERTVRADADEALAQQILTLQATVNDDITAQIAAEQTARATADEALAADLLTLSAELDVAEAAITTEAAVRATNDTALVQAMNAMWAITGATQAISQEGANLVTNWTAAQASKWSQLEAEVFGAGGQTIRAALAEEATLRANADGNLYGQYTVKIDTNGYVAGFGLASESSTAGENTSSFIIRADKFAMVMPGYGEHVPFAIGPSGATFTGLTEWANVTGSGKPQNYATDSYVGAPGNLIPDDGFYDPGWWRGDRAQTTWPVGWAPHSYAVPTQPVRFITINASAGTFDYSSIDFGIQQGVTYRVRLRMYLSPDFAGFIAPLVHVPGVIWACPGTTVGDPTGNGFPNGHSAASWGTGAYYERELVTGTSYPWMETRICGQITAGYAEFYLEVTTLFGGANQITGSNVSTYIANAAIGAAQIGSIALVGTSNFSVKSGTSGARMEMDSRAIKVFDANGVKRVQLGNLTV